MGELVRRILPPPGLPRQLVLQSAVAAVGWGVYFTGSVVFFTLYVGLTAEQVGIGLSVAGLTGLVAALPLGQLADRIGGRPAWVAGAVAGAGCFAAWPLARGFWSFLLVLSVQTLAVALAEAGRTVYTAAALPGEIRVRTMGFVRAYLNGGFAVGAGIGAAAIGLDSRPGLLILVLANAAGLAVNAFLVSRMPDVRSTSDGSRPRPWRVLRDHPYLALCWLLAVMFLNEVLFLSIVPLWAITRTDMPRPVLGALFALNTIMVVLLQVPATRNADSLRGSSKLLMRAGLVMAVACPVFALSGRTAGWATVAVLVLGVVLLTGTELWTAAAHMWLTTEVPPPGRRGLYIGAANLTYNTSRMVGPASLTFLAVSTGGWGWWVIAAIFALGALAVRPAIGWVERTPRPVS
jgi:MFS family permease